MIPPDHKRYVLLDGLGYVASYDTYRQAEQAATDHGKPFTGAYWIIRDMETLRQSLFLPEGKE